MVYLDTVAMGYQSKYYAVDIYLINLVENIGYSVVLETFLTVLFAVRP